MHVVPPAETVIERYEKGKVNIDNLVAPGAKVFHGVDARSMKSNLNLAGKVFDKIVHNFPHAGFHAGYESSQDVISLHRSLVRAFFMNAHTIFSENGVIIITHKLKKPFSYRNLQHLGHMEDLVLVSCDNFNIASYTGPGMKINVAMAWMRMIPLGLANVGSFSSEKCNT
ncbi:heavy metal-associated isoprenylated plant protein 41-like [Bidens hawaiensis]|uniref:heavy metal-associated isoprenylated plant protein 41-like n=1 Tax=Bidens hawaiensis TaxID=980011 RepID=UPI00404A7E5C